jgi:LysR family transcriptional regulator, chromosome initiation inhibitor
MSLLSPPLQAFLAIVKHKTVHGAADTLHLTQTAVTQRIRLLEHKLHTTLFLRSRRGMQLTSEGETLLRYCQATLDLERDALDTIKGAGSEHEIQLTLAGPSSIMHSRVIPQCLPVMKKFKRLLIHFDINDTENRHKDLRAGHCQLAIIQQEDVEREMASKKLAPERYVLVCTVQWKNRKLSDIIKNERIIDFNPSDQMTFNYLKHFDLFDAAHHDRHFANRTESLAYLLTQGLGYGVLTIEFCQPYIAAKVLIVLNRNKIYVNQLALAWFARTEPPKYFSTLINAIH